MSAVQVQPSDTDDMPPVFGRVLSAAFSAFMERGYSGASTAEIARRAKVSKRELYAAALPGSGPGEDV